MARFGLYNHRKFLRLVRLLSLHAPVSPRSLASGVLELLWAPAYEAADDWIGVAEDVELRCDWHGPDGALASMLAEAGFIDHDSVRGGFRVHDLWDHAPDHVQTRAEREARRSERGETISDVRRRAALVRWDKHRAELLQLNAPEYILHAKGHGEGRGGEELGSGSDPHAKPRAPRKTRTVRAPTAPIPADAGGPEKPSVEQVLREIDRASRGGYVYSAANKGQSVTIQGYLGRPEGATLAAWTRLGEYVAAVHEGRGGEPLGTPLFCTKVGDLLAKSARWDEAGRPPLTKTKRESENGRIGGTVPIPEGM